MIELIAMLTMLVDHIGVVFFPDISLFRIVGRLAFPLYAWGIVQGYFYTRNLKKYRNRLVWLAVLAQIPFMFVVGFKLNVIFTFLLCLVVLRFLESKNMRNFIYGIGIALFAHFFSDYGAYAIGLVLIFRYLKGYNIAATHLMLDMFFVFAFGWIMQPFSILATLIILNKDKLKKIKVNRSLYRAFYPAHLSLLVLIREYLKGVL